MIKNLIKGEWRTQYFNRYGTDAEFERCLTIGGKYKNITKEDIIYIAKEQGIKNPEKIIAKIAEELSKTSKWIKEYAIDERWGNIIINTINQRLSEFGYLDLPKIESELMDSKGRKFSDIQISINTKGHYELAVMLDGIRRRRFIRPNMDLYKDFQQNLLFNVSKERRIEILEELFP